MTRLRSVVLTVGAVLGTVCLLVAVGGAVMGVKALLFRSGSMGPDIPAGSIGFTRPANAADLKVGDVVSVVNAKSTRVTHRIVGINGSGDSRALTLQGDANPSPDAETYQVTKVDRVFFSVPAAGYVVNWLGSPIGLFVLGGAAVGILVLGFTAKPKPRPGRRRAVASVAAPVVAAALVLSGTTGTMAQFTDTAPITGATVASGAVPNLGSPSPNCVASNGVLSSSISFKWNGVTPSAAPRPQLANYEYELRFYDRNNNNAFVSSTTQAHTGAAGSVQTYSGSGSLLGNLLGLNLLSAKKFRVDIHAHLIGTNWYSTTPVSINWSTAAVLTIANFSCT